jgi:D-tagatose-1,6-bisphosphate aldolase subunit GatZ/KbaZ
VRERLDEAMLANPSHWQKYYHGDERALLQARKYSYSDRSRYYWTEPTVQRSLSHLLQNLAGQALPLTLLSQFLPDQYHRIRRGDLINEPRAILLDKVGRVLSDYSYACGYQAEPG